MRGIVDGFHEVAVAIFAAGEVPAVGLRNIVRTIDATVRGGAEDRNGTGGTTHRPGAPGRAVRKFKAHHRTRRNLFAIDTVLAVGRPADFHEALAVVSKNVAVIVERRAVLGGARNRAEAQVPADADPAVAGGGGVTQRHVRLHAGATGRNFDGVTETQRTVVIRLRRRDVSGPRARIGFRIRIVHRGAVVRGDGKKIAAFRSGRVGRRTAAADIGARRGQSRVFGEAARTEAETGQKPGGIAAAGAAAGDG